MDPITRALVEYDTYLRDGGAPADLSQWDTGSERAKKRKLHPSGFLLCDRKSVFSIMEDLGEIQPDLPHSDEDNLSFRVGYIFQRFVAEALAWKDALVAYELPLESTHFTGRADIVVNPAPLLEGMTVYPECPDFLATSDWLVDVKAVKSRGLRGDSFYPKEYYIAQLEKYVDLMQDTMDMTPVPVLYVVTRLNLEAQFLYWRWINTQDCISYQWGEPTPHKTFEGLYDRMLESENNQLKWLHNGHNGYLPPRIGSHPDEHRFSKYNGMCTSEGRTGVSTPSCKYFHRCWGYPLEPYPTGLYKDVVADEPL